MRNAFTVVMLFALAMSLGCSGEHTQQMKITCRRTAQIGEAVDCSTIDVREMEGHCFPPSDIKDREFDLHHTTYLVDATFDGPVVGDKDGWAYDWTCRLDSVKTATCHANHGNGR